MPPVAVQNRPIQADTETMEIMGSSCSRLRTSREDARAVIKATATGKWALIHGPDEVGIFDSFPDAAARAIEEFGVGSYLIRTGTSTVTLPASMVFQRT